MNLPPYAETQPPESANRCPTNKYFQRAIFPALLILLGCVLVTIVFTGHIRAEEGDINFTTDIRPILSNACFQCHGPDEDERKGGVDGLRLDTREGATVDLGGYTALKPGDPENSEIIARITSDDPDLKMPPPDSGKNITPAEVDLLREWIRQDAPYAPHWSYQKPVRPALPEVKQTQWPRNSIDFFTLARLEATHHSPSPEADRYALARRVSIDLTGLPPTLDEVEEFVTDPSPDAYERYVDRLLAKPGFGEHWARMWLDLARYADSAGYANDPDRSIWMYRDYVIESLNKNIPFDQFTIEQIAGDLLPNPSRDQIVATAFHRNTLTNSEGGTTDEEWRNAAIVDRVNTTFSVWMGTTMACAQCHNHKFDPITQKEYFQVFAILNNTADSDRKDEAPVYSEYTPDQLQQRSLLEEKIRKIEETLRTPTPEILAALDKWDADFPRNLKWQTLSPSEVTTHSGSTSTIETDGTVSIAPGAKKDTYTVAVPLTPGTLRALKLDVLTDPELPNSGPGYSSTGNFVLSRISAALQPAASQPVRARYVRISLPGESRILSLAEVQVFQGEKNIALAGAASQSSVAYAGAPERAIDGNTNGDYFEGNSVTHTEQSADPWWELDLLSEQDVDRINIWNRTDGSVGTRLANFQITLMNTDRQILWQQTEENSPAPSVTITPSDGMTLTFSDVFADYSQPGFQPDSVLQQSESNSKGWAIGGGEGKSHSLTLLLPRGVLHTEGWQLKITIEQNALDHHTLGRFRLAATDDPRVDAWAQSTPSVNAVLNIPADQRTAEQQQTLVDFFLSKTKLLDSQRQMLEKLNRQLAEIKPVTVPIMKELPPEKQRETHIQLRGSYLARGEKVEPGTPAAFPSIPTAFPPNRLGLAHWLVDADNPLTSRVIANRYWEKIFGIGLVATSEDFGSQGELPSHPELLDWLATELIRLHWDTKAFLKLLVTSATYRQSSVVTKELFEEDPDNRLLARGPRFRLSAENVRDQALALAGLLSDKMYGTPVKPPQPSSGLSAAFGSSVDWKTSTGEDRYRRAIYITWRRSNPYPSMATFDAPNREVCTLRRSRTNTPLQALVTLNDPVYVEAAQALARRLVAEGGETPQQRAAFVLKLCLSRPPYDDEIARLVQLQQDTVNHFQNQPEEARKLATDPLGPLPEGSDPVEMAAWTVVANVVLNLDELFMKR